jgi:hypothetical protein
MTECHDCRHNDQLLEALPTRERVFNNGLWRVAHAFSSALPGWMVVIPRRHVLSLSELTASEATSLGPLLRGPRVTRLIAGDAMRRWAAWCSSTPHASHGA